MSDRFDALLKAVAQDIEWPDPNLATAVGRRLEGKKPRPVAWLPKLAAAAVIVALLVGGLSVFSPATRRAVADFLGIGGVRIEYGDPGNTRIGTRFGLGALVSLQGARERVPFDFPVPSEATLGGPDEVYVDEDTAGGMVSLLYGERPNLPLSGRATALYTAFRADLAEGAFFKKLTGESTTVEIVEVNGSEGYWISGAPHAFLYEDQAGDIQEESVRLTGNVLLWTHGDLTLRLEVGRLDLESALRLATSVS